MKGLVHQLRETFLHAMLRRAVHWRPLADPKPGYCLIIGCNAGLARMLMANLRMVARQRRDDLHQIIIVLDRPRQQLDQDIESLMRQVYPELPLRFLYYSPKQHRLASMLRSPWVYAWMSWALGIAQVETQYALLHDFDALLIDPGFLQGRYDAIRSNDAKYIGIQTYRWGKISEEYGLVQTFEMIFDCRFVRDRFKPIHIYNHNYKLDGSRIWLDTFLFAQLTDGERLTVPVEPDALVHPGQMICQFQKLMSSNSYRPPSKNNLLLVPYYMYLSDDPLILHSLRRQIASRNGSVVEFYGRRMDLTDLDPAHVEKITDEAYRLEQAVAGEVRPDVKTYFEALAGYVKGR